MKIANMNLAELQFFPARWRRTIVTFGLLFLITIVIYASDRNKWIASPFSGSSSSPKNDPAQDKAPAGPQKVYKTAKDRPLAHRPFVPIVDPFPQAENANSAADLPAIPSWNTPPAQHVPEVTPLFIGFTRNWPLLQQTVVSFLTAGWPPEDIYVVENTGVMDANQRGNLTLQNPFYIDYHRLTKVFGVNVITTPSLQTFAQLQNMFLHESIRNGWTHYFWSHMDILVQSAEDKEPYKSFYLKCVDALRQSLRDQDPERPPWALRYFAYDWVTLMNVEAMRQLGGWDTMISYYTTDCDMYDRMRMAGMSTNIADSGPVYDTGETLPDLKELYRVGDERGSQTWTDLQAKGKEMGHQKNTGGKRNRWQVQQMGGEGEPFYRDMDGFDESLELTVQAGISVFKAKWGGAGCSLQNEGLVTDDQWMIAKVDKPKK